MRKRCVLGVSVCATDYEETCAAIRAAALERRPLTVTALAVHGVMSGALDPMHRARLNALDLVLPDGQPVRWGLNLLFGENLKDRVCGPELMPRVCRMCEDEGLAIALYGSRQELLDQLAAQLRAAYPKLRIPVMIPSRFGRVSAEEQEAIAAQIQAHDVAVAFVGLGCPRQEVWLYENRHRLSMPTLAVGAAFDFHAKRLSQAPLWMRRHGLEWLYRLMQEPRRLWRRYLLLNPLYLAMLAAQKLGLRRFEIEPDNVAVVFEGYA